VSRYDRESITIGRQKIEGWLSKFPGGGILVVLEGHSLAQTGELITLTSGGKEIYDYVTPVCFLSFSISNVDLTLPGTRL
jgi:hypothetical protein